MTSNQFDAHLWLSRMWGEEVKIDQKVAYRDKLNSWGIGKYDAEFIPEQTGENTSESKYIEYAILSDDIEKLVNEYMLQNRRTEAIINQAKDGSQRRILYDWYINQVKWFDLCKKYGYEKSQLYVHRNRALDAVYPFIPKEEILFLKSAE